MKKTIIAPNFKTRKNKLLSTSSEHENNYWSQLQEFECNIIRASQYDNITKTSMERSQNTEEQRSMDLQNSRNLLVARTIIRENFKRFPEWNMSADKCAYNSKHSLIPEIIVSKYICSNHKLRTRIGIRGQLWYTIRIMNSKLFHSIKGTKSWRWDENEDATRMSNFEFDEMRMRMRMHKF